MSSNGDFGRSSMSARRRYCNLTSPATGFAFHRQQACVLQANRLNDELLAVDEHDVTFANLQIRKLVSA